MHISCVNGKNVCKISKNGNLKIQIYKSNNILSCNVGHEIVNKTLYFVKRYYFQILRYLRKCMKQFNIIKLIKMLLHKLCHQYVKHIQNCNALYRVQNNNWDWKFEVCLFSRPTLSSALNITIGA